MVLQVPDIRAGLQAQRGSNLNPPTATSAAAFGALGAQALTEQGGLVQRVAEQQLQEYEARDRMRMLTELENFEQGFQQNLETIDAGSDNFVNRAAETYQQQTQSFLATQPDYLRPEAELRATQKLGDVVNKAVQVQQQRLDKEVEETVGGFTDLLTLQIRTKQIAPDEAQLKAQDFLASTAPRYREAVEKTLTQTVRANGLIVAAETDPAKAIQDIDSGAYNDVDAKTVLTIRADIIKQQQAAAAEIRKLKKEAEETRFLDPRSAADKLLQSEGVALPTPEQIDDAQNRLRIPRRLRAELSKTQANELGVRLQNVENADEFVAELNGIQAVAATEGKDSQKIINDIIRFSDVPPAIKAAMQVPRTEESAPVLDTLVQMTRDPDAPKKARTRFKEIAQQESSVARDYGEIQAALESILAPREQILRKAGVDPSTEVIPYRDMARDVLDMMLLDEYLNTGKLPSGGFLFFGDSLEEVIEKKLKPLDGTLVPRNHGNHAYFMSSGLAEKVDEEAMDGLAKLIIDRVELDMAGQFTDKTVGKEFYKEQAGWTISETPDNFVLRVRGQPIRWLSPPDDRGVRTAWPIDITADELNEVSANPSVLEDVLQRKFGE